MKDKGKSQLWLRPIREVAAKAGILEDSLIPMGRFMAKVDRSLIDSLPGRHDGKLVLVTAMSPTPAGEGKTTLSIGLTQSLNLLGKKAFACIRQPSLGPLLGVKGGAMGSEASEAGPLEDFSLQFNGDDYGVVTSHNLISAIIDNHIHHGNRLNIEKVIWPRVSTINDRALRNIITAAGKGMSPRKDEFHISAASEIMSMLCLSNGLEDFRKRIRRTIVAFGKDGQPVTVSDLGVDGAVAALMKNALNPNLAQSIEGAPVFIHGGPFGNISIGCSSVSATKLALKLSDFVLTEAGFSTELGAEKFIDILCRQAGFFPSAAVIVATLNALRLHGKASDWSAPDMDCVKRGMANLEKHIENLKAFGIPAVVALNRFKNDTDTEIEETLELIRAICPAEAVSVRDFGGKGGIEAARAIIEACEKTSSRQFLYPLDMPIEEKINTIAVKMYGADGITLTDNARADLEEINKLGLSGLPVCVAKTPKSFSDDPALIGRPTGFTVNVTGLKPATGAGYIVAYCGNVLLMPGMPEHPLAEKIDIDDAGRVRGI
ncbi:MAG: formate--tetrahydrofolate ligase [Deltaproteobacteria bacterium GWA2_54_12]|nr:MAG: formate--tetrahydrofolate ligase [Deltaproteobacteria bacterium GWA2_54_12]